MPLAKWLTRSSTPSTRQAMDKRRRLSLQFRCARFEVLEDRSLLAISLPLAGDSMAEAGGSAPDTGTLSASAQGVVSLARVTLSLTGGPLAEGGGSATVTASIPEVAQNDITVRLGAVGTASNRDFDVSNWSIVIAAGSTSGSTTLTAVQDSVDEADESIALYVSEIAYFSDQELRLILMADVSGSIEGKLVATIADDDELPEVTLSLIGGPLAEAGGSASITATLSAVSEQDVTVYLTFSGTANALADYTRSSNSILIPAGSTTGSIMLTALQDGLDEADETIDVGIDGVLSTEPGSGLMRVVVDSAVAPAELTAIIVDDDAPPSVTLSMQRSTIPEQEWVAIGFIVSNQPSAVITATLSAPSSFDVTVVLAFSGTARMLADYTLSATSFVIPAGSIRGGVVLTAALDNIDEPDESVIVEVSSVTNAYEVTPQQVTATIADGYLRRPSAESYIGRRIDDVRREVHGIGYEFRILRRDGVDLPRFMDMRDNRLNVYVEGDIITYASWEGGAEWVQLVSPILSGGVKMIAADPTVTESTAGIGLAIDDATDEARSDLVVGDGFAEHPHVLALRDVQPGPFLGPPNPPISDRLSLIQTPAVSPADAIALQPAGNARSRLARGERWIDPTPHDSEALLVASEPISGQAPATSSRELTSIEFHDLSRGTKWDHLHAIDPLAVNLFDSDERRLLTSKLLDDMFANGWSE